MDVNHATPELATRFARIALGHVSREYPNKLALLLNADADLAPPRQLYPLFWGSFDWHSCVHAHWLLAAILRRFPHAPVAGDIATHLDARITDTGVAAERANFERPGNGGFERPYGWAWLLMLAAELQRNPATAALAQRLAPLTERIVHGFHDFLPRAGYPVRSGAHFNSAFAMVLALDYACIVGDSALASACRATCLRWYRQDLGAPAWEPSGDDFLSPTLIEALAMQRVLPAEEFSGWFAPFLPDLVIGQPTALFEPATVSDRSDGKIAHLDGLNLSRAWCWRELATALPDRDARVPVMHAAANRHLHAALPHVAGDYMGEHWLASFAWLALTAGEAH